MSTLEIIGEVEEKSILITAEYIGELQNQY
jgi:hypothetical protein